MTDTKIEPCPFCGVPLTCLYGEIGYRCNNSHCRNLGKPYYVQNNPIVITAHNQLCEYVRLGKAAKAKLDNLKIKYQEVCRQWRGDPLEGVLRHRIKQWHIDFGLESEFQACLDMLKVDDT